MHYKTRRERERETEYNVEEPAIHMFASRKTLNPTFFALNTNVQYFMSSDFEWISVVQFRQLPSKQFDVSLFLFFVLLEPKNRNPHLTADYKIVFRQFVCSSTQRKQK